MDEDILAFLGLDESEALLRIEPFDSAGGHDVLQWVMEGAYDGAQ
jgi:hypothetical protein